MAPYELPATCTGVSVRCAISAARSGRPGPGCLVLHRVGSGSGPGGPRSPACGARPGSPRQVPIPSRRFTTRGSAPGPHRFPRSRCTTRRRSDQPLACSSPRIRMTHTMANRPAAYIGQVPDVSRPGNRAGWRRQRHTPRRPPCGSERNHDRRRMPWSVGIASLYAYRHGVHKIRTGWSCSWPCVSCLSRVAASP